MNLKEKEGMLKLILENIPESLIAPSDLVLLHHTAVLMEGTRKYTLLKNQHFLNCEKSKMDTSPTLKYKLDDAIKISRLYLRMCAKRSQKLKKIIIFLLPLLSFLFIINKNILIELLKDG